ncbi:cell division cycle protein 123 homolog [Oryza brachyantha]|uniref:cell division cycle protein 123 homolog n=1 Tax=Oryza brachyantha TaxID=4533 RepID=UPI0007766C01|nr:cell division cycle protein 123 homolog [Oryza brachyantha]
MLLEELLRCQIHEWYPVFRRHTVPTPEDEDEAEPLPFFLPAITSGRSAFPPAHAHHPDPVSLLDRDNSDLFFGSADGDDSDGGSPLRPAFPDLEAAVDSAIAELGGAALPKLNWSAPKDAAFMSAEGTIRCTCFAEVAMLLRSSDCVAHDLACARPSCKDFAPPAGVRRNAAAGARPNADKNTTNGTEEQTAQHKALETSGTGAPPSGGESSNDACSLSDYKETADMEGNQSAAGGEEDVEQESNWTWVDDGFQYYLALRKWYPGLRPESEFRCFVWQKRLVAVSQRDPSAYYPSLPGWSAEVQPKIEAFFEQVIEPQFASDNYTFDVYVRADGRVKLIDFNPWGGYTLPLLFTWEELEQMGREELEFRVVMHHGAVRPGLMTAVPYDMLDWGEGSGWDVFLKKADDELNKQMASLGADS